MVAPLHQVGDDGPLGERSELRPLGFRRPVAAMEEPGLGKWYSRLYAEERSQEGRNRRRGLGTTGTTAGILSAGGNREGGPRCW